MRHQYVHEMFSQMAGQYPGSIAIQDPENSLTYEQLHGRARAVAAGAVQAGVGRNDQVVVFGEDRTFFIESIIGVLMAGGAFVPLSSSVPRKRLETMIAECSPRWAIVQPGMAEEFSGLAAAHGITIVSPGKTENPLAPFTLDGELDPDGLIYIFFTSGSTGRPKAIAGRLKAIDHFIRWEIEMFGLGHGSRVSQLMSPMFDAFMRDIFAALCSGGTVCIPGEGTLLDGRKLGSWIAAERINLVHTVPSIFRLMLNQSNGDSNWVALRHVLLSGEPLLPSDVKKWYELAGTNAGHLVNLYGPTETTMTKFVYVVQEADQNSRAVPIGKPMKGARAIILDQNGKVCPPWKTGELFIRTPYRTLGYYGRPELTNEVFIPNPFGNDPSDLVYKTGDLARVMDDGNFELLGRRDNQVKIRGVRIELEEVESALSLCNGVVQSAVAVKEDESGEKRLVAYIVLNDGLKLSAGDLRSALKERLPEYMLPSSWNVLEKLPLTATGKVDRQLLEKLSIHFDLVRHQEAVGPRSQVEEILCGIWAEVLKVPMIGVHDNFFELGGHSLLATQLVSRIMPALGIELPLKTLFEAPTIAEMAQQISVARESQRQVELPPIQQADRSLPLPLSYAQQRLWFIDQLEVNSTTYNMPWAIRIRGQLDAGILRRSLHELVRRHESLRTCFIVEDGEPRQLILPAAEAQISSVDLRGVAPEARMNEAHTAIRLQFEQPFDLKKVPLFRLKLIQIDDEDHVLSLTMHHIISDGWSIAIFLRELLDCYKSLREGRAPGLPELAIQYADFTLWQRELLAGRLLTDQLDYWRTRLEGMETLQLPTDRPHTALAQHQAEMLKTGFDPEQSMQLRAMAQAERSTLFMLLLAGMELVLSRYSGQTDIVVGTDAANRDRRELEEVIGFFVNQLVLRLRFDEKLSGRDLLKLVRQTTLTAYEHQHLPFERLVQELQPDRDLARSPLFQVAVGWQTLFRQQLDLAGLEFERFSYPERPAKLDLNLILEDGPDGITALFEYSTGLFDPGTVQRMADHWKQMLAELFSRPERPIHEYRLLSRAEEQQLTLRNRRAQELPKVCAHELIAGQARTTPHAVAVFDGMGQLTYAELDRDANRLAHYLLSQGAGPERLIAVYLERSTELLTVLLAIMKTGSAYLPLDPAYPAARLLHMVTDAKANVLITRENLRAQLPAFTEKIISLDQQSNAIQQQSCDSPAVPVDLRQLAYLMYTSGSTGKPKGAMIEQRGMLNHLLAKVRECALTGADVVVQNAPSSFDISIWQFLAVLVAGGKVCIFDDETANDPWKTLLEAQRRGVTVLETVPTLLTAMLQEQERASSAAVALSKLRWVICNAEALPSFTANHWLAAYPHIGLINTYGATECSDDTSHIHIQQQLSPEIPYAPLGVPIANSTLYVLDEWQQLVPVGVAGEAYIGGTCVGRGYYGQPALTAEQFVPDAFSLEAGAHLYRTGDRVRWLADGNLEFLGRIDFQVKVRGHRIELGEVESTILRQPEVDQAVAMVREDKPGRKELVVYVVPKFAGDLEEAGPAATAVEKRNSSQPAKELTHRDLPRRLREFLKDVLPEYMVPSAVVVLDSIPRTTNGKVDRQALPEPERKSETGTSQKPRGAKEEILAGIFEEILSSSPIGIHDNFFDLGGHSLLATQVISRIRNVFQLDLPLRALFEAPTIAGLAIRIQEARGAENRLAPPLAAAVRGAEIPLSFAQQRLWFLDQLEPGNVAYNAPFALRLTGTLNKQALQYAINEIVRRHEVLRTSFPAQDGKPVQKILPELKLPVEEVDLTQADQSLKEKQAERLLQEEAERPFNLEEVPLVRVLLVRLEEQDHVLFVNMHHIVSDGWSFGIVIREFAEYYRAYVEAAQPRLPDLPIQYADFAIWQRQWLRDEALEFQLNYWRNQLAGLETLKLPTDRVRPAVLSHEGEIEAFVLSPDLTRKLKGMSRREGVTLFMTLLAALQVTLSKYSAQQDVAVGTAVANRQRMEIEGLIGFFVNTLVMRTRLKSSWTPRELLKQVRQAALEAYQHQDVPFEKLVDELHPERDLSRSPLFQVLLVLQNARRQEVQIPALQLSEFPAGTDAAKFELMFTLTEAGDEIHGELSYVRDLYARSTIQRLLSHLKVVLEWIVDSPVRRIGELSLLSESEEQEILNAWNQTRADIPFSYVHEAFEQQALRTPEDMAVKYQEQGLCFRELNERANSVAHELRKRGAGPESLIGIYMERSLEMAVSVLAVLKAGAAYVPLDPEYPAERLEYMLRDSRATIVLTAGGATEKMPNAKAEILDVAGVEATGEGRVGSGLHPDNAAYVIYTSGSTGIPKGTVVTHRNLFNHMAWMQQAHPLEARDSVLQKTPFSFDASVWEFYAPLLAGAVLVMAEPRGHQDPEYLVSRVRADSITVLQLVPSQLRMLLSQPGIDQCYSLRRVYCGGEALTRDLVQAFYQSLPWATLYNLYGPTEATIDATFAECSANMESGGAPIGKPIANLQAYVLDEEQQLVPAGLAGELYLGGAGLARGYLHQPRLTAERFVPHPFAAAGERLYRTGDQARWLPQGDLEFLGRLDHQVKVRGHRVELGEIEAVLRGFPGVEQALAVMVDGRIAAYLVSTGSNGIRDLRAYMQGKVPEYAIPSAFVHLQQMPLTPNGKIDRSALPAPVFARAENERYVEPRNAAEEVLCSIWSKLLNVERVGIHDNFFELGGDSILSIQVIAQAREANLHLTARQIFERQTVAQLAEVAEAPRHLPSSAVAEEFPLANLSEEQLERFTSDGKELEDIYPLTPMQLGLMFHSLYESSEVYFVQMGCHMHGEIDAGAFRRAWQELVRRHAILRTAFLWEGLETPVQAVWKNVDLPWREEDWRGLTSAEQKEKWQALLREDREQGFDFEQAPLLRLALIRTGRSSYYFAWSTHHMLLDGWSRQIVTREVFSLYQAYRRGETPEFAAAPKFRNYVSWLQRQDEQKAESFWREELKAFTAPTRFGLEREGRELEDGQSGYGELFEHLGAELTEQLEEFARSHQITLNTVVQGAWALLLSRYSGQSDVLFGATVSGRLAEVPEIENMVGLFINTLPVRVQVNDSERAGTFLKSFQAHQARTREYESSPLVKVQAWSEVKGASLFDSLVVFENYPADSALRREVGESIRIDEVQAIDLNNYPLTLIVIPGKELVFNFLYSRRIWDTVDAEKLLAHLRVVLAEVVRGADQPINRISLASPAERRQLLVEWNQTQAGYPRGKCLHELFAEQAVRTPDAIAVHHKETKLSYRELDERSSELAAYLRGLGLSPDVRVGICLERGPDMVAAMLGIMKAGGAYIPIDPNYPVERIRYMLQDSQTPVLLTQQSLRGKLPPYEGLAVMLDESWEKIRRESSNRMHRRPDGENLAYVIYTSGSTGNPKGVAIRHSSATVLVFWAQQVFSPQELSVVLASTSICFDLSVFEIFVPLSCGGRVLIAANALELPEMASAGEVTLINTVPSAMRELLRMNAIPPSIRTVNLAGEAVSTGLVQDIYQIPTVERVLNLYGPTEDTVYSTYAVVARNHSGAMAPIGRPIANTQSYVLDPRMELLPVGIAGELYLAGEGLARGYLNRPALTAEKFVPNPFSNEQGGRLYRTGDLARYKPDGTIDYLGRSDYQVKIRGHRIELGEIESVLESMEQIEQAVVIVREDGGGEKRLLAYVKELKEIPIPEVRKVIKQRLPEFMMPSFFVKLQAFPLTPNGKINRQALPMPTAERPADEESYVAPRNSTEEVLCAIWEKLLKVEKVGVHDNFFELGGDSILSMQAIARAREAGLQLVPRQVFEHPTVAQLAEVAQTLAPEDLQDNDHGAVSKPVPLTPIQGAFFEWNLEKPDHYNQAVFLELKSGVDSTLLEQVILALPRRHDVLRMKYEKAEHGWRQWCESGIPSEIYRRRDLSEIPEEGRSAALQDDVDQVHRNLDLQAGKLVQAVEYDLGTGNGKRLLLVIHHLVVDGVSWRVLLQDLERGYEQLKNGEPLQFGARTTSFRRWAEGTQKYSMQSQVTEELKYWSDDPRKTMKPLPQDYPGEESRGEAQQSITLSLEEEETRELLQDVPRIYRTQINDVLLTALARVIAGWTGNRQVLVNLEGHGREEILAGVDLSQTVGWFTTIFPVLLDLEGEWEAGRALKQIKEQLRQVPGRGFGYGLLRFVHPDEKVRGTLAGLPQAQISFNYLGQFDQVFRGSQLFAPAREGSGRSVAPENRSLHLIDIGGMVVGGRLQISWSYHENLHRRATIDHLAHLYMSTLRDILQHCRGAEAGGYTPSDFPLANINQDDLSQIASLLQTEMEP
jgi:amino acid adenylation domain-containing protein/non-ribosomal peptide synthase protein (TIGR01720 family)